MYNLLEYDMKDIRAQIISKSKKMPDVEQTQTDRRKLTSLEKNLVNIRFNWDISKQNLRRA